LVGLHTGFVEQRPGVSGKTYGLEMTEGVLGKIAGP
jgi:hypothetical protein